MQAEAERIGALLVARRQELERLVMACEVVGELGGGAPAVAVAPVSGVGPAAAGADVEAFTVRVGVGGARRAWAGGALP